MAKARETTKMMYNAPHVLLVCYDRTISWKGNAFGDDTYDGGEVDSGIVTTMMMLEATALGIDTLWVRGFHAQKVKGIFALPENIQPVCFLLLGYANGPVSTTKRKELNETVFKL